MYNCAYVKHSSIENRLQQVAAARGGWVLDRVGECRTPKRIINRCFLGEYVDQLQTDPWQEKSRLKASHSQHGRSCKKLVKIFETARKLVMFQEI